MNKVNYFYKEKLNSLAGNTSLMDSGYSARIAKMNENLEKNREEYNDKCYESWKTASNDILKD